MSDHDGTVRWARSLRPGQRALLHVFDVETMQDTVVLESTERLFEAPTWHPAGRWIVVNADGLLFRIDTDGAVELEELSSPELPELNNDHLISPDGQWHLVSANDGHLYRVPFDGGTAQRITNDKDPSRAFRHFLHGVSPDGQTLAYVGTEFHDGDEWGRRALWLLELATGQETLVSDGYSAADGPEFALNGQLLYFNSEKDADTAGHAQIYVHDFRTEGVQQLTDDERVNWFPHCSPDGRRLVYLSYPHGTTGHPADLPVELRVVDLPNFEPRSLVELFGGQGTINVSSWAPDSRRFAYVSYPLERDVTETTG